MAIDMEPVRRLLEELHEADRERHVLARDSPEYERADERVDQLVREVWDVLEAAETSADTGSQRHEEP